MEGPDNFGRQNDDVTYHFKNQFLLSAFWLSPETCLEMHTICHLFLHPFVFLLFKLLFGEPPEGVLDQDRRVEFANRDLVFN